MDKGSLRFWQVMTPGIVVYILLIIAGRYGIPRLFEKYGGSRVANNGTWKSFKSGKELKNESYGTYDQPGSVYPKINIQTRLLEILTRERKNNSLWQGISY